MAEIVSESIPLILAGKFPGHRAAVTEILKPEFQSKFPFSHPTSVLNLFTVVKECPSVEAIREYLAAMPRYDAPAAIIIGGGFSPSEFAEARSVPGADKVAWMRADTSKATGGPPSPEAVAKRVRESCEDHKSELSQREGAGEVWMF